MMYCPFVYFFQKRIFVLLIVFFGFLKLNAGIIETNSDVCLGNLTYFKIKGVSGITAVKWAFGDGFTSKNIQASHLYKNSGSFTVKVDVTTGSNTISDSVNIVVHELPVAILSQYKFDSCLYTNNFEFKDLSTASNSSNKITKRLIVWGDGDFDQSNSRNFGDIVSHHYGMIDAYKIKMEITDNKGCKASTITHVRVINGTQAKILKTITYPTCGSAQVCFKSDSKTSNGSSQTYIWKFDNGPAQSEPDSFVKCFTTTTNKKFKATLILSNPDNTCRTVDIDSVFLNTDSVAGNFVQNDSIFCYGSDLINISAPSGQGYSYSWLLDTTYLDNHSNSVSNFPKDINALPGYHKLLCTVSRGPCQLKYETTFKVIGPVARIKIFNQYQCGIDSRVFFIDTSLNIDKRKAKFYWTVVDPEGENCEIYRAINQNKYKNCNRSRDWFGKHDYTVPRMSNPISLKIVDTVSGCFDNTSQDMEHFHCLLCERGGGPIELCQGDLFLKLKDREIGPQRFSLDTGKTWLKFPSPINKPYKGLYGVLFEFKKTLPDWAEDFGDDSILVHRYDTSWLDTIFVSDFLLVKETMDTAVILEVESGCNPYKVKLKFVNPKFKKGDMVEIYWKDGNNQILNFNKDSILYEVEHLYRLAGLDSFIDIRFISHDGCARSKKVNIKFGKRLKLKMTGHPCINTEVCYQVEIVNWLNSPKYNALKHINWISYDDSTKVYNGINFCKTYNSYGMKKIKLITEDSLGCLDTMKIDLPIRQVKAGVADDSRISYCSELKQMYDSSSHVFKMPGDYIESYYWDFGSGKYTTQEKDPFRSFDLTDSLISTMHIVIDNNGCTDTFRFDFKLFGSFPKFEMIDTMGCSPLKVTFKNLSSKCSSYIWEYDDPENTTLDEIVKKDGSFIYDKAGKYYPKLIGIDTFYNPYTGAVYYCHETYDPKIAVTVFETKYAKLECPDTICLGRWASFICDANTTMVQWDFGDGFKEIRAFQKYRNYSYTKTGTFTIRYLPYFNFPNGQPRCIDSFSKQITVLGVEADFEIKNNSAAPIFHFKNLSQPNYATLWWDFGHYGNSSNNSTDQEPSHNYQYDTGIHTVCLIATVYNKCRDTVCKPIHNDYVQSLQLYNVFTPGNIDGLNDEYDVPIRGESLYELTIYDRWGVVVYSSDQDGEIGEGINWNGKLHNTGTDCPSGTYYYVFNYAYKIDPDTMRTMNGVITLIR